LRTTPPLYCPRTEDPRGERWKKRSVRGEGERVHPPPVLKDVDQHRAAATHLLPLDLDAPIGRRCTRYDAARNDRQPYLSGGDDNAIFAKCLDLDPPFAARDHDWESSEPVRGPNAARLDPSSGNGPQPHGFHWLAYPDREPTTKIGDAGSLLHTRVERSSLASRVDAANRPQLIGLKRVYGAAFRQTRLDGLPHVEGSLDGNLTAIDLGERNQGDHFVEPGRDLQVPFPPLHE